MLLSTETQIKPSGKGKASWVRLLNAGSEIFDGERMREIDLGFIKKISSEWRRAQYSFDKIAEESKTKPYRFPVIINHDRDGKRQGSIVDMKIKDNVLYAKAEWTDAAFSLIESENFEHVSIGVWGKYVNEKGEEFGPLVVEFSITEYPRVQSIGTIQETLNIELANKETIDMAEVTKEQLDQNKKEDENEKDLEEVKKLQKEKEEIIKETMEASDEEIESEEVVEEPSEDPMVKMKEELKAELMEYVKSLLEPTEDVSETIMEEETVEEELLYDEKKDEDEMEASMTEEGKDQFQLLMSMVQHLSDKIDSMNPSVKLKTVERGFEGGKPLSLSYEDKVNKYMKEGKTVGQAIKLANKEL